MLDEWLEYIGNATSSNSISYTCSEREKGVSLGNQYDGLID